VKEEDLIVVSTEIKHKVALTHKQMTAEVDGACLQDWEIREYQ
jgi:hypothetical protein